MKSKMKEKDGSSGNNVSEKTRPPLVDEGELANKIKERKLKFFNMLKEHARKINPVKYEFLRTGPALGHDKTEFKAKALANIGLAETEAGFREEAKETFEEAIKEVAGDDRFDNAKALAEIACLQIEAGLTYEGEKTAEKALKMAEGIQERNEYKSDGEKFAEAVTILSKAALKINQPE